MAGLMYCADDYARQGKIYTYESNKGAATVRTAVGMSLGSADASSIGEVLATVAGGGWRWRTRSRHAIAHGARRSWRPVSIDAVGG